MLPFFLIEEITVRESGESAVFDVSSCRNQRLSLTFGITHAVEHESIVVEVHGSHDGVDWAREPLGRFTPKSYCGTYELTLPACQHRYVKAVWSVKRWARGGSQPFFRFFVFAQPAMARTLAAGAA